MGNTLSSWGGQKRVQKLISSSGLPLQIDNSADDDAKKPLSTFTEAYPASGWFTGVKSAVTINKPVAEVYESLSKNLHHVFTPISECDDDIVEDNGEGKQVIFRIVRIPFKVAFVSGNLKLRLHVEQDRDAGKIHFESVKEGRLITRFIADFDIHTSPERPEETIVKLDSKVNCKSVPPAPFKNMVKDVMVRKMDSCMVDLLEYHKEHQSSEDEFASACGDSIDDLPQDNGPTSSQSSYAGFLDMVRSLSAPLRVSIEAFERRLSLDRPKRVDLQDTAHDDLGHTPLPASASGQQHLGVASVTTQSSLYMSSSSQTAPKKTEQLAGSSQKHSQAEIFTAWQNEQAMNS